jgi:hypothetical protein
VRALLVVLAVLLLAVACKAMLEPVCPPSDPHCDCMDKKRHVGCSDNYDEDFYDPAAVPLPFFTVAHDGGLDAHDGAGQ